MSADLLQLPLKEVLSPRVTPEMGFQSYELIKGTAAVRSAQKNAFLVGEITNPDLDYPFLDTRALDVGIQALDGILDIADAQPDPEIREAIWDSAGYRMSEMYWLKSSERLNFATAGSSQERIELLAERTQALNEELYGKPEKAISEAVHSQVWAEIDSKELVGVALDIKRELEEGTVDITHEGVTIVRPLQRYDSAPLPTIPRDLLAYLKEKFYSENADIVELVNDYWNEVISKRSTSDRVFTPEDMFEIFSGVHALRDPEGTSGVSIIFDPDASALSWETPLMSVKVGGKRNPIKSKAEALAKIYHEYIVHGGRSMNGLKTELPVLGTGVFSDADEGEVSDYLTTEEGWATMCEMSVNPEETTWLIPNIEKYLGLALAYQGRDYREVAEILWRTRLLMTIENGKEPTQAQIADAQDAGYRMTERIFRGTPTDLPRVKADGSPLILTFNKDLAYIKGGLQVIELWERYKDDPAMLALMFRSKSDLLNKRQRSLALKYAA